MKVDHVCAAISTEEDIYKELKFLKLKDLSFKGALLCGQMRAFKQIWIISLICDIFYVLT